MIVRVDPRPRLPAASFVFGFYVSSFLRFICHGVPKSWIISASDCRLFLILSLGVRLSALLSSPSNRGKRTDRWMWLFFVHFLRSSGGGRGSDDFILNKFRIQRGTVSGIRIKEVFRLPNVSVSERAPQSQFEFSQGSNQPSSSQSGSCVIVVNFKTCPVHGTRNMKDARLVCRWIRDALLV